MGDARFQMKCFSWLQRLRDKNSTILLVSHDTNTITTFCDRALILEDGKVFAEGDPKRITSLYFKLLFGGEESTEESDNTTRGQQEPANVEAISNEQQQATSGKESAPEDGSAELSTPAHQGTARYGTGEAELLDYGLFDQQGNRISLIQSGAKCRFSMILLCKVDIPRISCGFAIKDRKGTVVWGVTNISYFKKPTSGKAGETLEITADCTMWLADGDYFVNLGAAYLDDGNMIDFLEDGIHFKVTGPGGIFTTATVNLDASFKVKSISKNIARKSEITGSSEE